MRRMLLLTAAVFATAAAAGAAETPEPAGGLVVHLGCGDGRDTLALQKNPSQLVYGLDTDPANVAKARALIAEKKRAGVAVDRFDGERIPLVDNLVNLLVADDTGVPEAELLRVLAPRGVARVGGKTIVKPWPDEIDEWTHYLHDAGNNAVARDARVGPPRHMQYLSDPLWSRHHDKLASISSVVTARGRIFYIRDRGPVYEPAFPARWSVVARDAFNGVFLWKRDIDSWTNHRRGFRSGPVQIARLLVTDGDRVFAPLGLDKPVSVLDARTGDVRRTLEKTAGAEEILCFDGTLFVQVGTQGAEHALIENKKKGVDYKTTKAIAAVNPGDGTLRWRYPASGAAAIMPRTLAAATDGVFFQENGAVVCLDRENGAERWRQQIAPAAKPGAEKKGKKKKRRKNRGRSMGWTFETLVVADGTVLYADNTNLYALDAGSGKTLWQRPARTPFGRTPSVDILVIDGTVWHSNAPKGRTSGSFGQGVDLRTGKVAGTNNLSSELVTVGHHHRCYRNKGAGPFIIEGWRGLEFRDTKGDDHARHNWIRGICQYGVMPANGLVYLPPHNCGCYWEAMLHGFWALAAARRGIDPDEVKAETAIEKGPAYGTAADGPAARGDWPMHRRDPQRSGVTPVAVPTGAKPAWSAAHAAPVTAPVVAGGTLVTAAPSTHRVFARDAATGEKKWSFSAGAPVDSTPTIHAGGVIFGSADGHVYRLRLSDGRLAWRFRAAPADLKTVARRHVESLWPVHGSVLVQDGVAYFAAGRSSYLDGGIFLYGLDAVTGAVTYRNRLNSTPAGRMKPGGDRQYKGIGQNAVDYKTLKGPDRSDAFSMAAGNITDIMVGGEDAVYLRHMKFGRDLKRQQEWDFHLFSTYRLIDGHEAHRSHWFFGRGDFSRIPVAYEWLTRGSYGAYQNPFGKLLVFDGKTVWGSGHAGRGGGYGLFAYDRSKMSAKKDFPSKKNGGMKKTPWLVKSLDIHPRALLKAGPNLVVAGFPKQSDVVHEDGTPIAGPGVLLHVAAADGTVSGRRELPAVPVFDGMSAAGGRLYIAGEDGSVVCLAE